MPEKGDRVTAEIVCGAERGEAITGNLAADDSETAKLSKLATRVVIKVDSERARENVEKEKKVPLAREEKTSKYKSDTKSANAEHIPDGGKTSPHPIVDGRADPRESAKDSVLAPRMRTESR